MINELIPKSASFQCISKKNVRSTGLIRVARNGGVLVETKLNLSLSPSLFLTQTGRQTDRLSGSCPTPNQCADDIDQGYAIYFSTKIVYIIEKDKEWGPWW